MSKLYGREALRRALEHQTVRGAAPGPEMPPPEAPYEDPASPIHVWAGEKWIAYDRWLATASIAQDATAQTVSLPDADCLVGECGAQRVWLVKEGERWLMFAGSRKPKGRRRDFASPYLAHAIRTAEQWYGAPAAGWHAETKRDAKRDQEDAAQEERSVERGDDALDLDGE